MTARAACWVITAVSLGLQVCSAGHLNAGAEATGAWSTRWGSCVRAALRNHRKQVHTVHLLCQWDHIHLCPATQLHMPFTEAAPVLTTDQVRPADSGRRSPSEAFVVVASSESYVYTLLRSLGRTAVRARFILSWPGASQDEQAMRRAFQLCWEAGILRVIVIDLQAPASGSGDAIDLFGYNPFRWNNCSDVSPVRIATWEETSGLSGPVMSFPRDFEGCPLVMLVDRLPPYWLVKTDCPGGAELYGQWAPLVRALEQGLNTTFVIRPMPSNWSNANDWDIAVGWFSSSSTLSALGQFTETFRSACYSICVPHDELRRMQRLASLVATFHPNVGLCMVLTLFVGALVFRMTAHMSHKSLIHIAWRLAFVQHSPAKNLATTSASRLFLAHWLLYHVVITSAFLAAERSARAAPTKVDRIQTMKDLVQADLQIEGRSWILSNLEEVFQDMPSGKRYLETHVAPYPQDFNASVVRREVAYLCGKIERQVLAQAYRLNKETRHELLENKCIITLPERLAVLHKDSAYANIVSRAMATLNEVGLMAKIVEGHNRDDDLLFRHKKKYTIKIPVKREDISHAWGSIFIGWIFSIAALVLELVFLILKKAYNHLKGFIRMNFGIKSRLPEGMDDVSHMTLKQKLC